LNKDDLWAAYLAAQLALHSAIDQQGSTPADDAACVAGVRKTIDRCREAVRTIEVVCAEHTPAFFRRYARGDF